MERQAIVRSPTALERQLDRSFRWVTRIFAWLVIALVVLVVGMIAWQALPALRAYGASFIVESGWSADKGQYCILPERGLRTVGDLRLARSGVRAGRTQAYIRGEFS